MESSDSGSGAFEVGLYRYNNKLIKVYMVTDNYVFYRRWAISQAAVEEFLPSEIDRRTNQPLNRMCRISYAAQRFTPVTEADIAAWVAEALENL